MKKIKLCILQGNKGLLVDLNDINITNMNNNGKMTIIKEFDIDIELLEKIIIDAKNRWLKMENTKEKLREIVDIIIKTEMFLNGLQITKENDVISYLINELKISRNRLVIINEQIKE